MKHYFTIGRLYKNWDIEMTVNTGDDELTFSERIVHPEYLKYIQGRRLSILDIPRFEEVAEACKERLDDFLTERYEKDTLNIDSLLRFCELHRIKYEKSGPRLVTAYRNYIKEIRNSANERESKGQSLCVKAVRRRDGLRPGIPENHDEALRLLNEAIALEYLPAYGHLAILYIKRGLMQSAIETAEKGVSRGDGLSMIVLGNILSDQDKPDMHPIDFKRAAKLYLSACEKGYSHKAMPGLRRLINLGEYTPKGNQFMQLVMYEAKRTGQLRENSDDEYYLDPEYREAMNLKEHGGDEEKINEILEHAVGVNGKTWLYGNLAASYMRMQKWGKAAHTAIKSFEAGEITCFGIAARLAAMGADFTGFSDVLGKPDYEKAIEWSIRNIEEDKYFGFVMLNHLIAEGHLDPARLPEGIAACLDHFNAGATPERRDINNFTIDCSFNKKAK